MSDKTGISWTDSTWNPTAGCSLVSPGCARCYAMGEANRLGERLGQEKYRGLTRIVNGRPVWTGEVRIWPPHLAQPLRWRRPRRIFVDSMSDLFHEGFRFEDIAAVFGIMAACPQHTFQVLTKRIARALEFFRWLEGAARHLSNVFPADSHEWRRAHLLSAAVIRAGVDAHVSLFAAAIADRGWPLPNVWLGVSAERQQEADERIPQLVRCPAAVRFVSMEPLLEGVDLRLPGVLRRTKPTGFDEWPPERQERAIEAAARAEYIARTQTVDWVIVGGESGDGARPMHPDWARSLRDQCQVAQVPYFFKQRGNWTWPDIDLDPEDPDAGALDIPLDWAEHPERFRFLNRDGTLGTGYDGRGGEFVANVGKKRAGNLLDGRTWEEFPEVAR